jgi:hypothetical protein
MIGYATSMMPPTDDGKRVSHLDLVVRSGGIALEDGWMVIHWGEGSGSTIGWP